MGRRTYLLLMNTFPNLVMESQCLSTRGRGPAGPKADNHNRLKKKRRFILNTEGARMQERPLRMEVPEIQLYMLVDEPIMTTG